MEGATQKLHQLRDPLFLKPRNSIIFTICDQPGTKKGRHKAALLDKACVISNTPGGRAGSAASIARYVRCRTASLCRS
jgi:hypothetical protein